MTRTLYGFQQEALRRLPEAGGYLAFEQGLGKTLTSISYAELHGHRKVLVISPLVALGVWGNELNQANLPWLLLGGTRKDKARGIEGLDPQLAYWLPLNYEATLEPAVERAIKKWKPDLIIIDEAHKAKTATAKRSKVLHRLGKVFPTLLLSGTPITKNLLDLYSQYKIIDPDIWDGESWTAFRQRHGVWGGYLNYELKGYRDVERITEAIAPWTVIARKEDVLDLPAKTFQHVPVTLGGQDWAEYRKMAQHGVSEEWTTSTPLEVALRLAQLAGRAKRKATVDWVSDLVEQGEQVVVYARFLEDVDYLADALAGGYSIQGRTSQKDRDALVKEFQMGGATVIVAQIAAASTAVTLHAASNMVFHGIGYEYEHWAQAQDRIHRIGMKDAPANYYYMTAVGPKGGQTIDGLVVRAVENKEDVAAMVTADPTLLIPKED